MRTRIDLRLILAMALSLVGATLIMAQPAGVGSGDAPARPKGPCDIYAAAGDPCVAAHSSTRALYTSYNGPLYQAVRQSDRQESGHRRGAACCIASPGCGRVRRCGRAGCILRQHGLLDHKIYDQSGNHNDLTAGSARGIQRAGVGRVQQCPGGRHGAGYDHGPQGLRRVHRAGHGPARRRSERHRGSNDQAEGQYSGSSTGGTSTPAAASTTATRRSTAAMTRTTGPWKPPLWRRALLVSRHVARAVIPVGRVAEIGGFHGPVVVIAAVDLSVAVVEAAAGVEVPPVLLRLVVYRGAFR